MFGSISTGKLQHPNRGIPRTRRNRWLDHFDGVSRHPNVGLLEANLQRVHSQNGVIESRA